MGDGCDAGEAVVGALFVLLGAGLVWLGVLAWTRPDGPILTALTDTPLAPEQQATGVERFLGLTQERSRMRSLRKYRTGTFFVGLVWIAVGVLGTASVLNHCAGFRELAPLSLRIWPPMFAFIAFALAIGAVGVRKSNVRERTVTLAGVFIWSFAGGQAAAFHTGVVAAEWFAISLVAFVATGLGLALIRALQHRRKDVPPA